MDYTYTACTDLAVGDGLEGDGVGIAVEALHRTYPDLAGQRRHVPHLHM